MKYLLILLVCISISASAQDTITPQLKKPAKHELAVNATFFIKQFLNFSNTGFIISPYIISYKRISANNRALRLGLGASFNSSSKKNDDPNVSDFSSKATSFDFRIGMERQIKITKAWSIFVGGDLTPAYDGERTISDFSTDKVTTKSKIWAVGGGPVLGIQVHFNDRISLFTETAVLYTYSQQQTKVLSTQRPQNNQEETTTFNRVGFVVPTSLFFAVRLFK